MMKGKALLLSGAVLCFLLLSCSSGKRDFRSYSIGSAVKNYPELAATAVGDTIGTVYSTTDSQTEFCGKRAELEVVVNISGRIVRKSISTEEIRKKDTLRLYTKWLSKLLDTYGKESVRTIVVDDVVETNTKAFSIKVMDYFLSGTSFMYILEGKNDTATITITRSEDDPMIYSLELRIDDNRYFTD